MQLPVLLLLLTGGQLCLLCKRKCAHLNEVKVETESMNPVHQFMSV